MSKRINIVATIEPASANRKVLTQLIKSGVNTARLDFLSVDDKACLDSVKNIKKIIKTSKLNLDILLSLSDTGIKVGKINSHGQKLADQDIIILATHSDLADVNIASLEYKVLPVSDEIKSVHLIKSDRIFIDQDRIKLLVDKIEDNLIYTKVIKTGMVQAGDQIIVSGYIFDIESRRSDIEIASKAKSDYLSLALANIAELKKVKKILKKTDIKLIVRLESLMQVKAIMKLVKLADGLFIDHQHLAWEVPESKLDMIEKELISKCHNINKEVMISSLS
ncbi:hypothetical protein HN670_02390 [bacterium]|nr:hypothetical protein [bacterium]